MNYRKEYATLVGIVDRAITMLEQSSGRPEETERVGQLLVGTLQAAEARYMEQPEPAEE